MKARALRLYIAEDPDTGMLLADPATGQWLVDANRAELRDQASDLFPSASRTPRFKIVTYERRGVR